MRGLFNNPALESVDFQSPVFFQELSLVFEELQKAKKKEDIEAHEGVTRLTAVVKHHTGMQVVFDIGQYQPRVEIPAVNKNNILINSAVKNFVSSSDGLRMIEEAGGVARGSVDLKKGKVSGIYSDVKCIVHLPLTMFTTTKFTPQEIAAATLHEIGHLFTYFEFMTRSVTTNQVLAGIAKVMDKSDSVKEREAVFISAKKQLRLSELDVQKLCETKDKGVAEVVIISNVAKQSRQELGANIYDFSSWEYLSDQYAARQGAGRHLVTALDKIYRGHFNKAFRNTPSFLAIEAFKAVVMISTIIGLAVTAVGPAVLTGMPAWALSTVRFGLFFSNFLGIMLSVDSDGDGTYDKPEARLRRIRNQIVENLKDKSLSKDDQERLAEDLVVIDDVLKDVNDRRQLIGVVIDFISPSARKYRTQELLQKELEAIAANELFVKAAQLRQHA